MMNNCSTFVAQNTTNALEKYVQILTVLAKLNVLI
jgi:hypothetical protein